MTEIARAGNGDYTTVAHRATLQAVRDEQDFGGWLAGVLASASADLGSTFALTAGRPGSWEATSSSSSSRHCQLRPRLP